MIDPPKNKTASGGIPPTQVFADGEDTHTLRLENKFSDLRVEYVNWILLRRRLAERSSNRVKPPKKRKRHPDGIPFSLEVPPRFELGIEVLQTFALPLGYGTECPYIITKQKLFVKSFSKSFVLNFF